MRNTRPCNDTPNTMKHLSDEIDRITNPEPKKSKSAKRKYNPAYIKSKRTILNNDLTTAFN